MAEERTGYPTQKPDELLARIITNHSRPADLVLDTFVGSGTTSAVAQRLGRRWIGCDINKGAIQTTAKRLHAVMREQAGAFDAARQQALSLDDDAPPAPAQLAFHTLRVNDYDLQIQHNEAVQLACDYMGVTRTRTDSYFDGTLKNRLVRIVPFNHPLGVLDLEDLKNEIDRRPEEERDVTLICLGLEMAARAWIETHNRHRPLNKIDVIELRTDRKYGGFMKHEALRVSAHARRLDDDQIEVEVTDVYSPTITQRLNLEEGVFQAQIDDWRAVVDCLMIDTAYDGEVFNVALSDVPDRKQDLVEGVYRLPAPPPGSTVAIKIIDMLGEELIVTRDL